MLFTHSGCRVEAKQPALSAAAVEDRRRIQAKAGVHSTANPNTSVGVLQAQAAQEAMDGARIGNSDKPIAVQVSLDIPYPTLPHPGWVSNSIMQPWRLARVAQPWCRQQRYCTL